jgi:hypothetical protein
MRAVMNGVMYILSTGCQRGACIDPHGFDAGKLIKGEKRHILVDMQGLLLHAIVHSAGVQDRDGGIWLLATLFGQFPFLAKLFADSAYAGSIFHTALAKVSPNLKTEIVKGSSRGRGCPLRAFAAVRSFRHLHLAGVQWSPFAE